jgi:hypothetical protein
MDWSETDYSKADKSIEFYYKIMIKMFPIAGFINSETSKIHVSVFVCYELWRTGTGDVTYVESLLRTCHKL